MRTRRSNRNKSYVTEPYDLGEDFEEIEEPPLPKRAKVAEDEDDNFSGSNHGSSGDEEDVEQDEKDLEVVISSDSEGSSSESEELEDFAQSGNRRQGSKAERTTAVKLPDQYLGLAPISTDTHVPRGYAGYVDRNVRGRNMLKSWYGPEPIGILTAAQMFDQWSGWSLLPPKETIPEQGYARQGTWVKDIFERESVSADNWLRRLYQDHVREVARVPLSEQEALPYIQEQGSIPVLLGPPAAQTEVKLVPGQGMAVTNSGVPVNEDDESSEGPVGWIVDTGGIAISLDWAYGRTHEVQLVAMAILPLGDQEFDGFNREVAQVNSQSSGTIQLWEFTGKKTDNDTYAPSNVPPKLRKTIFTGQGRVRRVKWNRACAHLAVLSSSGTVCVIDFADDLGEAEYGRATRSHQIAIPTDTMLEKLVHPLASCNLVNEDSVKATAMSWINVNRLAIGYSDGSIALWSIYPNCLVSRHVVHHAPIVDMASAYPTFPYLVASNPMGGTSKIIDLRAPSYETTDVPATAINIASNLMSWSDHLLGFFTNVPSSNVLNTRVAFMHHSRYPITRRILTSSRLLTALAVGRTHPFLLVGTIDGSLWAINPQYELVLARRTVSDRIKIFQHEHRPGSHFASDSPARQRGASRVLQGFRPEKNNHDPKRPRKASTQTTKLNGDAPSDPTKGILPEPLSRITAVEWNPNQGWGCWAAAATASGIVRVMDLGLDRKKPR